MSGLIDSILAEENVTGSILIDAQRVLRTVRGIVEAEDFADANTRAVFRAAVELDDDRLPLDPVTIQKKAAELGTPVSSDWLRRVMNETVTTANAAANAEAVHRDAIERAALNVCMELTEGKTTPEETLERLQDVLAGRRSVIPTPSEDAAAYYSYLCKAAAGEIRTALPTGFRGLDEVLGGGLAAASLTTIAARSSVGKSTVALAVAENIVKAGGRVLFVSLEMTRNQIQARRLASRTGISSSSLLSGRISEADSKTWKIIAGGMSALSKEQMLIWDKPCRVGDIELKARASMPLDLIVIDYLTNITDEPGESGNTYISTSNTVRRLQRLASAIDVPILLVSQLNRAADSRDNKRPRLSDLRDTGKIEECSDAVLLLYRESYYSSNKPKPWEHQTIEVNVAKNRHGQTGTVFLDYVPMVSAVRGFDDGFTEDDSTTPFDGGTR